jgi:hypothetical protein
MGNTLCVFVAPPTLHEMSTPSMRASHFRGRYQLTLLFPSRCPPPARSPSSGTRRPSRMQRRFRSRTRRRRWASSDRCESKSPARPSRETARFWSGEARPPSECTRFSSPRYVSWKLQLGERGLPYPFSIWYAARRVSCRRRFRFLPRRRTQIRRGREPRLPQQVERRPRRRNPQVKRWQGRQIRF